MEKVNKIFKWTMWALIGISVAILVWGSIVDFAANDGAAVDVLLRWGYVMLGIAVAAVVLFGITIAAINNPKSLIRLVAVIAGVAVICLVVYLISPGAPALGVLDQPAQSELKLTDTILNLTYLTGGLAIAAILFNTIWGSIRK